jgi:hypothetical protein
MKLIVSEAAVADLERLHAFLADKNPQAASWITEATIMPKSRVGGSAADHYPSRRTCAVFRPTGAPPIIAPFSAFYAL